MRRILKYEWEIYGMNELEWEVIYEIENWDIWKENKWGEELKRMVVEKKEIKWVEECILNWWWKKGIVGGVEVCNDG